MKKYLYTLIAIAFFITPELSLAQEIGLTPAVITEKALPRDIFDYEVTVTNNSGAKVDIYAIVNNVDTTEGKEDFEARADVVLGESLANWIEVSRGVIELSPGESTTLPVRINVNLNAEPGNYHALISFSKGPTRGRAEELVRFGESITVHVEVVENVKERLQLSTFSSERIFFGGSEVALSYDLENTGNKTVSPNGEVRIYDRRGQEVGTIPVTGGETVIEPDQVGQLASVWDAGKKFGKYKALLDVEYGSQLGTVNDTVYFWIIPWKQLLMLFLILATFFGWLSYYMYQRYEQKTSPAYMRAQARKYRRFEEDSLMVPEHDYSNVSSTPPSDDHLLNLR